MLFFLSILFQVLSICCLNCLTPLTTGCQQCDTGFSLAGFNCVSQCGIGYTSVNNVCTASGDSKEFINLYFTSFIFYTDSFGPYFMSSNGTPLQSSGNMVPTPDRGIYTDTTSNLYGNQAWAPYNEMTLELVFRPISLNGIVMDIINDENESFLMLKMVAGIIQVDLLLLDQSTGNTFIGTATNVNLQVSPGVWFFMVVRFRQSDPKRVNFAIRLVQGNDFFSFIDYEIKVSNILNWVLGDKNKLNTAEGFYYKLVATNEFLDTDPVSLALSTCEPFFYKDANDGACYSCPACGSRLFCVDNTACSQCYSNKCSSCDGIQWNNCNTCSNSATPPFCCPYLCRKCTDLTTCEQCQINIPNYYGICIQYMPQMGHTMQASPLVYLVFETDFVGAYSLFVTGYSQSTYQFFNSPDIEDPIPSKQRGLYFNGLQYLIGSSDIHPILSLSFLIKPTSLIDTTLINFGDILIIQPFSSVLLTYFQTDDGDRSAFTSSSIDNYLDWVSLSLSISYTYPYSIVKIYKDNVLELIENIPGVPRNYINSIYIGRNPSLLKPLGANYIGFLYRLVYWNSVVTDFSGYSVLATCGSQDDINCLSPCGFLEYLNDDGTCLSCMTSCSYGCISNSNCNICYDSLCLYCDGFYSNCNGNCVTNSQMVNSKCTCLDGFAEYNAACLLCNSNCATCDTIMLNGCLTCSVAGSKMAEGFCYSECPTGYLVNNNNCDYDGGVVLDLNLYEQFIYSKFGDTILGSSDSDVADSLDPLPEPYRGYYFSGNSEQIVKPQVLVLYEFSIALWIKIYADGKILRHGNLEISTTSSTLNFYILSNAGSAPVLSVNYQLQWTNFIVELDYRTYKISTLSLYKSFLKVDLDSFPLQEFFFDTVQDMTIGGGSSFRGFLSSMSFNNSVPAQVFSTLGLCNSGCPGCIGAEVCLSECDYLLPADDCGSSCGTGCLNCYSSSLCQMCNSKLILVDGSCVCAGEKVWDEALGNCVLDCFSNCVRCDMDLTINCYECSEGYYLIDNVCVFCPLGYGSGCIKESDLGFHIQLTELTGVITEKINKFKGAAGKISSFYPTYDENDPKFAAYRGFYFNNSYILFEEEFTIFGPEFTIELWFNPSKGQGTFLSKSIAYESISILKLYLNNDKLNIQLKTLKESNLILEDLIQITQFQWNFIQIFVKHVENTNFEIASQINQAGYTFLFLLEMNFVADKASQLMIGKSLLEDSSEFIGFIYEIKIFNTFVINLYKCDEDCPGCGSYGNCIPTCGFNYFWAGGLFDSCEECSVDCLDGCIDRRESCNLCNDDLCYECTNLEYCNLCKPNSELNNQGQCECIENYINQSSYCSYCDGGYVLANECIKCQEKCLACNLTTCIDCIENSVLINGACSCIQNYTYSLGKCVFNEFYVNASVSKENRIYLDFSQSLYNELTKSDLNLTISDIFIQFDIDKYTATRYVLILQIDLDDYKNEIILKIVFNNEILSNYNSLLATEYLEVSLIPAESNSKSSLATQIESVVSNLVEKFIYALIAACACINPNPASLWTFISSIQMIIFVYLINVDVSDKVSIFLIGLRKYNIFPNAFEYLGLTYGVEHQFPKAKRIGFITNSIFMNIGKWITSFGFFVLLYYLMHFIRSSLKCTKFKDSKVTKFFDSKCKQYRFGFFLRFWIQAYIEILVSCFISLYSIRVDTVDQALNLYFSILFSFFIIFTPITSLAIGFNKKNQQIVESPSTEVDIWGTLFYEFKDDQGAISSQFYTFYFLRRFLFISQIFILEDYPIIQLCISEIITVAMLLILWYKKPFFEPILNLTNIANELILGIIFGLLAVLKFDISDFTKTRLDLALIILVNAIVGTHIIGSIAICIKAIKLKIENRKMQRVGNDPEESKEYKIEIAHLENVDREYKENVKFLKNKLHPSPVYSADNSFNLGNGIMSYVNENKSLFGLRPGKNSSMNSFG